MSTKCSISPLVWPNCTAVQSFTTPLRIGEEESTSHVQLYPNSSSGNVTFNTNGLVGMLGVHDAVGKTVFHEGVSENESALRNLPESSCR
ncbi:MAG TPA: hypothetical protein VEY71_03155 [Chitinophagales bacterium]|nr:hypothetical protein [Chitinophagales bacterium]